MSPPQLILKQKVPDPGGDLAWSETCAQSSTEGRGTSDISPERAGLRSFGHTGPKLPVKRFPRLAAMSNTAKDTNRNAAESRLTRIKQLFRRVWRNIVWHNCFGKAAELAFYFQLALFPLLIFLLSLIGFVPQARQTILFWVARLMPADASALVSKWANQFLSHQRGGVLSFSLVFSLWSASVGVRTLMSALNRAYEVAEGRSFWKSQLVSLALTLTLSSLVIGGVVVIGYGNHLLTAAETFLGLEKHAHTVGLVLRSSTGLVMLFSGMSLIYYFGPNVKQDWRSIVPGTIFAIPAIIAVSYLFSLYLRYAPSYYAVYGSLGAVVILNLWLYLVAFMIYLGAEINSEKKKLAGQPIARKK